MKSDLKAVTSCVEHVLQALVIHESHKLRFRDWASRESVTARLPRPTFGLVDHRGEHLLSEPILNGGERVGCAPVGIRIPSAGINRAVDQHVVVFDQDMVHQQPMKTLTRFFLEDILFAIDSLGRPLHRAARKRLEEHGFTHDVLTSALRTLY